MGRPKKDVESEAIGVRISKPLLTKLDKYAAAHKITRSYAAAKGIRFIVHSKECISCGTLNPGEGNTCAKCGTPLYDDIEILKAMESILETDNEQYNILNKSALKKYLDDGLTPVFKLRIERNPTIGIKYYVDTRFKTQTGIEMQATDKELTKIDIDKDMLLKQLPQIKKEFESNPDLKEETRKKYFDSSSDE